MARRLRAIQWAAGSIGRFAIQRIAASEGLRLVGCCAASGARAPRGAIALRARGKLCSGLEPAFEVPAAGCEGIAGGDPALRRARRAGPGGRGRAA